MSVVVGNHVFFTDPSNALRNASESSAYALSMNAKLFEIQLESFGDPNEHISLDSPHLPEDLRKIMDYCLLAFQIQGDYWFAEITNASECQMTGPSESSSKWQWLALHKASQKKDCYVSRMHPFSRLRVIASADIGEGKEVI